MPLKLNVGLSRKVGEANYGSRGASINVEMELDSTLISEPVKLRERIRQLFGLVRTSLAEELNGGGHASSPQNGKDGDGNQRANGNNVPDAGQRPPAPRPATSSQVKALYAITRSQGLDLKSVLQGRFRVGRPDDLTIKEASALIDELKKSEKPAGG
jgi:hypothetical protein